MVEQGSREQESRRRAAVLQKTTRVTEKRRTAVEGLLEALVEITHNLTIMEKFQPRAPRNKITQEKQYCRVITKRNLLLLIQLDMV